MRACDALAEVPGTPPLAIEHTKIETFTSRKLDDARFRGSPARDCAHNRSLDHRHRWPRPIAPPFSQALKLA